MRNALMWLMWLTGNFYRMRMINQKITVEPGQAGWRNFRRISKRVEAYKEKQEPIGTERDHLVAKVVVCFSSFDMILSLLFPMPAFCLDLFFSSTFFFDVSTFSWFQCELQSTISLTMEDVFDQSRSWRRTRCTNRLPHIDAETRFVRKNIRFCDRPDEAIRLLFAMAGWCWLQIAMEQRQPQQQRRTLTQPFHCKLQARITKHNGMAQSVISLTYLKFSFTIEDALEDMCPLWAERRARRTKKVPHRRGDALCAGKHWASCDS